MSQFNQNAANRFSTVTESAPSVLLSNASNETFFRLIGGKCKSLATAVTQVFVAEGDGNKWTKKCCGVAGFIKDNPKKSYFIRVYDIEAGCKIWEQELYNRFKYNCSRPWFHSFEADKCMAALNFANDKEAQRFYEVIQEKLQRREQNKLNRRATRGPGVAAKSGSTRRPQAPNPALNNPALNNSALNNPLSTQPVAALGMTNSTPSMPTLDKNVVKRNKNDNKKDKKKKLTKDQIGLPSEFKHVGHIGFNPDTGFDMNNLDPDMKMLFSNAGVTEEQLQDKETAAYIYDFIEKRGGMDRVRLEASVKRPPPQSMPAPPPPPMRSASNVPPPAPSRVTVPPGSKPPMQQRAQPPPPPFRPQPVEAPPPPPPSSQRNAAPPLPTGPRMGRPGAPPPAPPSGRPPAPPSALNKPSMAPPAAPANIPAPPPPPPPAPAPPPMPTGGLPSSVPSAVASDGRSALMDAIRGGKDLKAVDTTQRGSGPVDERSSMLQQIQQGVSLSKVDESPRPVSEAEDRSDLAGALARALKVRQAHIQNDDDEDDSDGAFDDEDWDD